MKKIKELFDRSKKGILFGVETKIKIGYKIEKLVEKKGFKKLLFFFGNSEHTSKNRGLRYFKC